MNNSDLSGMCTVKGASGQIISYNSSLCQNDMDSWDTSCTGKYSSRCFQPNGTSWTDPYKGTDTISNVLGCASYNHFNVNDNLLCLEGKSGDPLCYGHAVLSTNYDFAYLILADGHWPQTSHNVTVITQWMASENPPSNWWNRNNPLNNGFGSGGGVGLESYPNLIVAASYIAQNLSEGKANYGAIAIDFSVSASPSITAVSIYSSPWSCGHYSGYNGRCPPIPPQSQWGLGWHSGPVPEVAAPLQNW